jgi:diguanylate cyclase (GGDEF)-like protein
VIQRVSELLRHAVRGADLVGRLGGDEFVILLQLPAEAGTQTLERILDMVRGSAIDVGDGQIAQVTLSVGVAASRGRSCGPLEGLMGAADAALYVAKDRGRNQVVNLTLEAERGDRSRLRLGTWQIHRS